MAESYRKLTERDLNSAYSFTKIGEHDFKVSTRGHIVVDCNGFESQAIMPGDFYLHLTKKDDPVSGSSQLLYIQIPTDGNPDHSPIFKLGQVNLAIWRHGSYT